MVWVTATELGLCWILAGCVFSVTAPGRAGVVLCKLQRPTKKAAPTTTTSPIVAPTAMPAAAPALSPPLLVLFDDVDGRGVVVGFEAPVPVDVGELPDKEELPDEVDAPKVRETVIALVVPQQSVFEPQHH